ncbi:hypothetical protein J4772_08775 [Cohnella sp. LGH]|uniref:hypothetical protein n=1 Tax=Cohnella sp. LGH TaxID=1619153 RepID=UPI001ADCC076|nr:hypothetical protein [Cohnella sp. LGH]QTH44469.1 hypothetical protein J4772_08775 [Cohnella sp. LGH]
MKHFEGRPRLGIQGPTVSWLDPWEEERSASIMRTGTGSVVPAQDQTPPPRDFMDAIGRLGADFYVHHVIPGAPDHVGLWRDAEACGMDVCLGNEYGNINGPYIEGTSRFDVADADVLEAAESGRLMGLLYDEPEHLQINAAQYRKDGFYPHWGATNGLTLAESQEAVVETVAAATSRVRRLLESRGFESGDAPLIAEHVFPVLFHTHARGGMDLCPKIMKESFQPLQLSTALGAAKQYGRRLWICADLWGPDAGPWFTRTSGFPGHSPEEYASALRMGYWMGPSHLFAENVDVLLKYEGGEFRKTEFGEVWEEFARKYVPENPLSWSHSEAEPDIAFIHADDSNYGQNERLYGNHGLTAGDEGKSVFHVWHLLSHRTIPAHGSCMHIPGYSFPRHKLKADFPQEAFPLERGVAMPPKERMHPLFYPINNVLVYDERVGEALLGTPRLIVVAGTRLSEETLLTVRRRAEQGAAVIIASWLVPERWRTSGRVGEGTWIVADSFLDNDAVQETLEPFIGGGDCWRQRFGSGEVRMFRGDAAGFTLDFEIVGKRGG